MSIWTKDDVDKLRPERGGSNENARRKYFARYGNVGWYTIADQQMLLALLIALTLGMKKDARLVMAHRYDERRLPRPQKGDDHTVWKDFIKQVYIDKRFCGDAGKWPCVNLCMGWRSGLLLACCAQLCMTLAFYTAGGDDEGHAGSRRSPAASRGRDAGERRCGVSW
jgi:hypothetical protein